MLDGALVEEKSVSPSPMQASFRSHRDLSPGPGADLYIKETSPTSKQLGQGIIYPPVRLIGGLGDDSM